MSDTPRAVDAFTDERPEPLQHRPPAALTGAAERVVGAALPLIAGASVLALFTWGAPRELAAGAAVAGALLWLAPRLLARVQSRAIAPAMLLLPLGAVLAAIFGAGAYVDTMLVALGLHAVAVAAGALLRPRDLAFYTLSSLVGAALIFVARDETAGWIVAHLLFAAGFGMLGRALLYGAVRGVSEREQARVDAELLTLYDDARMFRIVGRAPSGERRIIAATQAVRDALYRMLNIGVHAVRADNAFVYWLSPDGERLVLREQCARGEPREGHRELPSSTGPLSLIVKKRRAVRLVGGDGLATHRDGAVGALLAVPIVDGDAASPDEGRLCVGVVVFDRERARAFEQLDEETALRMATELSHAVQTERVLAVLDEERREKARVFTAARLFGGVVREDEAVLVALQTAMRVTPLAAVAYLSVERSRSPDGLGGEQMRLVGTIGEEAKRLELDEPAPLDPETWVGRAIAQGALLPHVPLKHAGARRGLYHANDKACEGFVDVRVVPLFAQGERVGAMVFAANRRIERSALDSLGVVADLAGVAALGARHFEALEKQATTDGLTGLLNRRSLNQKLEEAFARAQRSKTPLSVILSDIDHFKSVNDTYGHGVGDDVLVGVSAMFAHCARSTDVVARYGGEEFCLVLEDTDTEGALQLANRIRTEIAAMRFDTEIGPLEVTSSFGVATLGRHAGDVKSLLPASDAALYRAKDRGRNRAEVADPVLVAVSQV